MIALVALAVAAEPAHPDTANRAAPTAAPTAPAPATATAPPAIRPAASLLLGEALVEQSSGSHRAQPAALVAIAIPLSGRFGLALDVLATTTAERSDVLALDQHLVRPAALATVTFARPVTRVARRRPAPDGAHDRPSAWLSVDAGLGPALNLTVARWIAPERDTVTLVEPAARGRLGLEIGLGEHLRVRGQGGLSVRPTGVDHDYTVGAAWAW